MGVTRGVRVGAATQTYDAGVQTETYEEDGGFDPSRVDWDEVDVGAPEDPTAEAIARGDGEEHLRPRVPLWCALLIIAALVGGTAAIGLNGPSALLAGLSAVYLIRRAHLARKRARLHRS